MAMDSSTSMEGKMKSHMELFEVVLMEMGTRCCTSTTADFKTACSRFEHEGMSFLTISLPTFGKDFEKSLDIGRVDPSLFVSFSKRGKLPRFLSGFSSLVFSLEDGTLLPEPSIDAIHAIRQISLFFSKVSLPCSDARTRAAFDAFVKCEQEVKLSDAALTTELSSEFVRISEELFGSVFARMNVDIYDGNVIPKHGPGSTADRIFGNQKYNQCVWTERLERVFPHGEFLFTNWRHFLDAPEVHLLEPGDEIPVRVISVPKTLKTPRIIGIEPTCMQYAQQGISRLFVEHKNRDDILSHMLGIKDQIPNQEMALDGSLYGNLATLDLSEASDRVSNQHVRLLTQNYSWLAEGIDACRSRKADVPGHGVLRLAKFASMGSALCFPMEAAVFLTVIFMGIQKDRSVPLTRAAIAGYVGKVRVYGDDIVVPVEHVDSVVAMLETFGFRVNSGKSFWTGKFRESCGKEYYAGHDVSVVRFREILPTHRKHASPVMSTVSLRNQMYFSGNWKIAAWLDSYLRRLIPFPTVEPESPALGRHSFLGHYDTQRQCPQLQKPLVRAFTARPVLPIDRLDGHGALLKFLLTKEPQQQDGNLSFLLGGAEGDHLERAGRPQAVDIKLGWVSAT